jgi:hypothetical protein
LFYKGRGKRIEGERERTMKKRKSLKELLNNSHNFMILKIQNQNHNMKSAKKPNATSRSPVK